jgi:lysyl-tRNA synthetase class II
MSKPTIEQLAFEVALDAIEQKYGEDVLWSSVQTEFEELVLGYLIDPTFIRNYEKQTTP